MFKRIIIVLLMLNCSIANAAGSLDKMDIVSGETTEKVVLEITKPTQYEVFTSDRTTTLVIDLKDTMVDGKIKGKLGKGVKIFTQGAKTRITISYGHCIIPLNTIIEKNSNGKYNLIVIVDNCKIAEINGHKTDHKLLENLRRTKDLVVAVDAGHGGTDSGAIGKTGLQEKDVTLSVAKRLAYLINRQPGMQAVLIRNSDDYIDLKDRTKIAKIYNADIFISIHADAFHNRDVKGVGAFVFSTSAEHTPMLDSLAAQDDGMHASDEAFLPSNILFDVSERKSSAKSMELANYILDSLSSVDVLHVGKVQEGRFRVLRHTDMPAVLVELGFISNKYTEKNLKKTKYQNQLAKLLHKAIIKFQQNNRNIKDDTSKLAGFSRRLHVVTAGDTLSSIARKYDIELKVLKEVNRLTTNNIKIGDRLTIPVLF